MTNPSRLAVLLLSLLFLPGGVRAKEGDILISDVQLFDGQKAVGRKSVLISDGKIAAIGEQMTPTKDCELIDGQGKTLMPGLIDCHVHTFFIPQLRQAAKFGVTTELDMMSIPMQAAMFRRTQLDGKAADRADFFSAGAAVTVAGGHGTQFGFSVPTLSKAEDAQVFIDARVEEGSDYIKIIYEDGQAFGMKLPTLSPEMVQAAVAAAKSRNKLVVAHIGSYAGAKLLIEAGVDGLVHTFADKAIDAELIQLAQQKSIFVVPTLCVISNAVGKNRSADLVRDPNVARYLTGFSKSNLQKAFPIRQGATNNPEFLLPNIRKLAEAGVPILAGSDAPNPGTDHGVSMLLEIELLVEAGLTNEQALAAATSLPARCFQLKDRGRVERGLRADLILIDGDPTREITEIRKVLRVWKAGVTIPREAEPSTSSEG